MLGVGRNLQTPCLQPDQLLNGSKISRLFAQKNIWLKPVESIQDIDQCLITDMLPVSTFMSYPQKEVTNVCVVFKFILSAILAPKFGPLLKKKVIKNILIITNLT